MELRVYFERGCGGKTYSTAAHFGIQVLVIGKVFNVQQLEFLQSLVVSDVGVLLVTRLWHGMIVWPFRCGPRWPIFTFLGPVVLAIVIPVIARHSPGNKGKAGEEDVKVGFGVAQLHNFMDGGAFDVEV